MGKLNLKGPVTEFVKELDGRYQKYISDEFLNVLLVSEIKRAYSCKHKGPKPTVSQLAYDVGAYIFESLLENRCAAGGNDHHVAQALAEKFAEQ